MSADDDLRWRLGLLREALEAGKVKFTPDVASGMEESLRAVRYGSDGQVDLDTVDGRVRAMALAIAGFHQRDEAKALISLYEVQSRYFEFIRATFGEYYEWMLERGANPQSASWAIGEHPESVTENSKIIAPFLEELRQFWQSAGESCEYHLQDIRKLKGVFGGDLFPSYSKNIASTTGLYLDTIVLTDPFMNSKNLFDVWDQKTAVKYFVKLGLNVLNYESLALAEFDPPIIAIIPFKASFNEHEAEIVMQVSEPDILKHGGLLFDRSFASLDEMREFATGLNTIDAAVAAIKRADRFLIDTDWTGSLDEQIVRAMKGEGAGVGIEHPGQYIFTQAVGRMRQANDILLKSRNLLGTPLIEAETSWRYLNWKLEYDAALEPSALLPLHVVKGLQRVAETDMEWIGNIPPQALIEMRKEGALDEVRSMLSSGIEEVAQANPTNFFRSADHIVDNIQNAFQKHQDAVKDLRAKGWRFWGQDVGSWIVKGSIELGAALAGTPTLGVLALGLDQVTDSPKLKELPKKFKELRTAKDHHARSPMALFFKHRN